MFNDNGQGNRTPTIEEWLKMANSSEGDMRHGYLARAREAMNKPTTPEPASLDYAPSARTGLQDTQDPAAMNSGMEQGSPLNFLGSSSQTRESRNQDDNDFTRSMESLAESGFIKPSQQPQGIMGEIGNMGGAAQAAMGNYGTPAAELSVDREVATPAPAPAPGMGPKKPSAMEYVAQRRGIPLEAMLGAMNSSNESRLAANLGEAGDKIGASIAGVQASPEGFRNLAAQSDMPVKNVQALRKGEVEDMSIEKQMRGMDPNSPEALALKKVYGGVLGKLGMDPSLLEGLAGGDIKGLSDPIKLATALKRAQMEQSSLKNLSPGAQAADKAFGKEYSNYIAGGGVASAKANIARLDEAVGTLKGTNAATGPMVGLMPDVVRDIITPKGRDVQDTVETVVQQSLKQILGGQFSEREADRLIQRAYNPMLSEELNIKRIDRLKKELNEMADRKEEATRYFEKHKTLDGFIGDSTPSSRFMDESDPRFQEAVNQGIPPEVIREYLKGK